MDGRYVRAFDQLNSEQYTLSSWKVKRGIVKGCCACEVLMKASSMASSCLDEHLNVVACEFPSVEQEKPFRLSIKPKVNDHWELS